jgi:hypothetical protein
VPCVATSSTFDLTIAQSPLDMQDQAVARETDRQGLGLTCRTNG